MDESPADPFYLDPDLDRLEGGRFLLRQLVEMPIYGDVCRAIYALSEDDLRTILLFQFAAEAEWRPPSYKRLDEDEPLPPAD